MVHNAAWRLAALVAAISTALVQAKVHYWPRAHGHHGQSMLTTETLPKNFSSAFAWRFHHPRGRFSTVMRGSPLIDSEKNVLILTEHGLFKLDPEGQLLWTYLAPSFSFMNVMPCLMDGVVYGGTADALTYAVDLQTGKELWKVRHSDTAGTETHYVDVHHGILIAAFDTRPPSLHQLQAGNFWVLGMNASNGDLLWALELHLPAHNFSPQFLGDGSFLFMDVFGGVHRVMHDSGQSVWYVPSEYGYSSSEGGVSIAPDGRTAFACSNNDDIKVGFLRAHQISDGTRIWEKLLPAGCTSWAVIAKTSDWGVLPVGDTLQQPLYHQLPPWLPDPVKMSLHLFSLWMGPCLRSVPGLELLIPSTRAELIAFDAYTGATKWTYRAPDWQRLAGKGDEEGVVTRSAQGMAFPFCSPTAWGAPALSGDDTVYVGHVSGLLYAVKDHNSDGYIDPEAEVSTFDMDAAPLRSNPAWAPGMMAVASCDSLFVFKT